jgi:hypothetical protein
MQAVGRGKKEAEQHCARQALEHIASEAPQLGAKAPAAPWPPAHAHLPVASPRPAVAEVDSMPAEQLRQELRESLRREARLLRLLNSIQVSIQDELDML